MRRYSELILLPTFEERYEYLRLDGHTCEDLDSNRLLRQMVYRTARWREVRDAVILRDNGCDLAVSDRVLGSRVTIHHLNPLTTSDVQSMSGAIFDLENLVCCSHNTHMAIHYGSFDLLVPTTVVRRSPYDTCPWRKPNE